MIDASALPPGPERRAALRAFGERVELGDFTPEELAGIRAQAVCRRAELEGRQAAEDELLDAIMRPERCTSEVLHICREPTLGHTPHPRVPSPRRG